MVFIFVVIIFLAILSFIHIGGGKDDEKSIIAQIRSAKGEEIFDIMQICQTQQKTQSDRVEENYYEYLNYLWYEELGNSKEEYLAKVNKWLEEGEITGDSLEEMLEGESKEEYDYIEQLLQSIEKKKLSKDGTKEDVWDGTGYLNQLSVGVYIREYKLRWKCFIICPTAAMLQQSARAALDVETVEIKDSAEWDVVTEYAGYGIQGYVSLMFYALSGESKADCCYWIAKTYKDLAENTPGEYTQYEQHCYLMAYAFAAAGEGYAGIDSKKSHHLADLAAIRHKVESVLDQKI